MGGHSVGQLAPRVVPLAGAVCARGCWRLSRGPQLCAESIVQEEEEEEEEGDMTGKSTGLCKPAEPRLPTRGMNMGAVAWHWLGKGSFLAVHPASL